MRRGGAAVDEGGLEALDQETFEVVLALAAGGARTAEGRGVRHEK